jgi:hypothetical protein
MSEEKSPLTPEQIAQNQAVLDRIAKEFAEKDAQKKHDDMVAELCATNPAFKNLHDKYKSEIFTLNPTLKTITDKNQMIAAFIPSAEILSERDKKIVPPPPPPPEKKEPDNPELDKPLPQANGTYKNKDGEAVDKDGNKLLAEGLSIPDYRKTDIPTDAAPAVQARLNFAKNGQNQVQRFEKPKW